MNELILGLLMFDEQTSYSIKKAIKEGLSLISSSSLGTIQNSLKSLEKKSFIKYKEMREKGKTKKIYQIQPLGIEYFNNWINTSFDVKGKKNSELKKLFFMSFSDENLRKHRIQEYIEQMILEKKQLEVLKKNAVSILPTLPIEKKEIATYQVETINYGIDFLDFEIQWYTDLIKRRHLK